MALTIHFLLLYCHNIVIFIYFIYFFFSNTSVTSGNSSNNTNNKQKTNATNTNAMDDDIMEISDFEGNEC